MSRNIFFVSGRLFSGVFFFSTVLFTVVVTELILIELLKVDSVGDSIFEQVGEGSDISLCISSADQIN